MHTGGDVFATASTWTANATGWQREVTYPSGKSVTRQFDGAGRLDHLDIDGRTVDFRWTGEIYRGRVHEWSDVPGPDAMQVGIELDGLGRGVRLSTCAVGISRTGKEAFKTVPGTRGVQNGARAMYPLKFLAEHLSMIDK